MHKNQLGVAKADAQHQRKLARETHTQVLQGLVISEQQTEALQKLLEECRVECRRSKAESEARYGQVLRELRRVEAREVEVQRQLDQEQARTRRAEAAASGKFVSRVVEGCCGSSFPVFFSGSCNSSKSFSSRISCWCARMLGILLAFVPCLCYPLVHRECRAAIATGGGRGLQ